MQPPPYEKLLNISMKNTPFTLKELAELTDSTLIGDPNYCITNVESLELATSTDASFLANPRYEKTMLKSKAGVIFVMAIPSEGEGRQYLVNSNPSQAFQKTFEAFYGTGQDFTGFEGVHPTAVIHPTVILGKQCTVGPHVVIDKDVVVGDNTVINAGCYVGPHSKIGAHCILHPRVTIRERCILGNRVILQPGVIIGSCGFGYLTDKTGIHSKLNQLGGVIVHDDVEIGANTTVDRSRFKNTEIGKGTKIDNLVQVGHGVIIGEHCIVVAQTGISGSTKIGSYVTIGGQAALAGHLQIADRVVIAGRCGVTKSLMKAGAYGGLPARPLDEYQRTLVHLQNIGEQYKKLKALEGRVKALEGV